MITLYVPRDTTAVSLGADEVAMALARVADAKGIDLHIVRNGSRGLFWLEPLVEVETDQGRIAYGPVMPEDVPALLEAGLLEGAAGHPLHLGLTEEIPYLKNQQRLTFARAGITGP